MAGRRRRSHCYSRPPRSIRSRSSWSNGAIMAYLDAHRQHLKSERSGRLNRKLLYMPAR